VTDLELYARGTHTLLAAWQAYAHGSPGAGLVRHPGVAAAVFPAGPEREFYNNALLARGMAAPARAAALDAMEAAYLAGGVAEFAAWTHESDEPMCADLEARGYRLVESTRAMGMRLSDLRLPRPAVDLADPDWAEYLRILGVPGLLTGADETVFHVAIARLDGAGVATAMAFDHAGDCGIYNVGTLDHARGRGLGTAVTLTLALDAAARGCTTATLQSTPMAEHLYATIGFRDLGLILEYGRR
jgi:GNAT superfamily N-acetyltransferase